jgi:hypothetical protein
MADITGSGCKLLLQKLIQQLLTFYSFTTQWAITDKQRH